MTPLQSCCEIIAIHGSASSSKQWQSLQVSAGLNARVQAPNIPDSDAETRLSVVLDSIANSAAPVHLVAHSFGSSIAMKAANAVPANVASVTLYDPVVSVQYSDRISAPSALRDVSWRMRMVGPHDGMALFLDYWAGEGSWANSSARRKEAIVLRFGSVLRDFDQLEAGAWESAKRSYEGPLTILRGSRSPAVIQETSRHLQAIYPRAWSYAAEDLDHMTPMTKPGMTDALFLDSIAAQTTIFTTPVAA